MNVVLILLLKTCHCNKNSLCERGFLNKHSMKLLKKAYLKKFLAKP